jgi:hypothetical protein
MLIVTYCNYQHTREEYETTKNLNMKIASSSKISVTIHQMRMSCPKKVEESSTPL